MTEILLSKIKQKCQHCACSSKIFKFTMFKCNAKQPSKCYVRFQVLTALIIISTIFWDETSCSLVDTYQCSGKTCFLHFILPKLEPRCSSKTVVPVYPSTQRHIPEYCRLIEHSFSFVARNAVTFNS